FSSTANIYTPSCTSSVLYCRFFFYYSRALRDPHSFPTRRSSDLYAARAAASTIRLWTPGTGTRSGICSGSLRCNRFRIWSQFQGDRKSTRLNSSHVAISYAVFCLKKKKKKKKQSSRNKKITTSIH